MEVEKKSSKGGFLSFFDWGGKSRKKLFPNNNVAELDGIKRVEENVDEHGQRYRLVEYDENKGSMNNKGNGDFNCASSRSSDDGGRTGAPSVVARLMGLDTMPNVNVNEPCLAQNMDSQSLRNGYVPGSSLNSRFEGFYVKDQNLSYNQDGFLRAPAAMSPQKMPGRPIERFQTETLPPRSAKTIPIPHHKLLSPIKSPGFIPTKNAAYIMEAASRMIDPKPRTVINDRMASHASSSVPIRMRDLKERLEASQKNLRLQKPNENVKRSNGNRREAKTMNSSLGASRVKAPLNSVSSSESSRSRIKVGPHTEVAKSNIHRRDESVSSSIKNSASNRVVNEAMSKQVMKRNQHSIQQIDQPRTTTVRTSSVLRQNNQKQNDTQSGNSSASNSSVPNQLKKKSVLANGSSTKTARKIASDGQSRSRKDLNITDTSKRYPVSKTMNSRQQTKSTNGTRTNQCNDTMSETVMISKDGKSIQCNAVIDGGNSWGSGNNKDAMDVISFTFSSPIKKHVSNYEDIGRVMGSVQTSGECSHNSNNANLSLSPQRFSEIGPDALGILLEQKLKELTYRVDSSSGNFNESHETCFQDSVLSSNVVKTSSENYNNYSQFHIANENSDSVTEQESNNYDLFLSANKKAQEIEDCYSVSKKNVSIQKLNARLNSVSYAEDSPSNEGWCSSSENSCSLQEVTMFEVSNTSESCDQAECEVDSMEALNRKPASSYDFIFSPPPTSWELQYVKDVIGHAELRVNNFLLGQVENVINSSLFDQLENRPSLAESETFSDNNKVERRLLFDCISELTNQRCQQLTTGCCKSWSKWAASSHQADSFSRELYREISSLKNMEELMVDEVVDNDMSSGKGRWVNFDAEASEEYIEIDKLIFSSLMDEVVADLI